MTSRPLISRRALCARALALGCAGVTQLLTGCAAPAGTGAHGGAPAGAAATGSSAHEEQDALVQRTFFCFDTPCSVGADHADAVEAAVAQCQEFERLFSRTIATSDIGRLNAADGAWTQVDPRTVELVRDALRYAELSDGMFDVSIGGVTELWDFHEGVVADAEALAAALPHVGWQLIQVDAAGSRLRLDDPDTRLDLGGIAKGYVADQLLDALEAAGATHAFVNLGGNVAVRGGKPDGSAWSVGVRDPHDEQATIAKASVMSGSVVTSGLYERSFEAGGRRYWHILDPRTGYPVETSVVSASVLTERSVDGEGLVKPLFFRPPDDGIAWLEAQGVDGLLVLDDGRILRTAGSAFQLTGA